ncbi:osmotin-like protein [Brachypodium distachyon]|uniref:Osmotin-like protein n=1 Tax=Brachypodium distachyon TaxID=15368 RepID=I1IHC4_BRADI|nr:osmotin-like protein [Brachypodium distachyon]KQJ86238.1 hypothetical protein BRADI_4g04160v3 [Brachypodium distachyon]|eukprot:XP_003578880.1 osmotin-like protein [Brachypodium distachyon]
MAMNLATVAFLLASTLFSASSSEATTLTIHNLCPYPVWPLIVPNSGSGATSPFFDNSARLDPNALVSLCFPDTVWSGRVTARTGCDGSGATCGTGAAPPSTVAQLTVHGDQDLAVYSVSLVDGFNVPMVISPQGGGVGQCPQLGCAFDLNRNCPPEQSANGGAACRGPPGYFKVLCPQTRTTPGDKEPLPQNCHAPGELKIVLCQPFMLSHGAAVEADS